MSASPVPEPASFRVARRATYLLRHEDWKQSTNAYTQNIPNPLGLGVLVQPYVRTSRGLVGMNPDTVNIDQTADELEVSVATRLYHDLVLVVIG